MRSDRMLGYEYAEDSSSSQITGHAGLLPYLDLACVLNVLSESDARIGVCGKQGWMVSAPYIVFGFAESGRRGVRGRHSDIGIGCRA